uniref:Transcription termination and cleavage factor C-terminal domain-containing protein n=1 Tax=Leersia perrieri TaxID=77586 RepID=A0A0D9WIK6_9ORYZ
MDTQLSSSGSRSRAAREPSARIDSGRSSPSAPMAASQPAGEALAANISAMSRPEMYDLMSQMKGMIDLDQERVRRMLVDNPDVTRALFRAQIVLGMVKTPKSAQSSDMAQPTAVQAIPSSSVKSTVQDHASFPQPHLPASQQNMQPSGPFSSGPSHLASSLDLPTMSANPQQPAQAKGYPIHQMPPTSTTQTSQHQNVTQPPQAPSQYSNVPSHMPIVHSQPQQPLQIPGMFNQQLQPPLPQLPRPPNMQPFAHQMHPQVPSSFGLSHTNAPQHILQQSMFHPGGNPQTSFLTGQPPLPNQPPPLPNQPPPQLYQGSSHAASHYNPQSMQIDRSTPWGRGNTEASGSHFPGLPGLPGQMSQGIGGIHSARPEGSLTPDMEKMLVQQVLSMSPDQINMLPPEQRQQVLQLRDMLRQ